jgi:hypothetical protein
MPHEFCPGYASAPFDGLAANYPGEDVYPPADFRTEWGPIFHRGRLDGTARVLVIGQDPATHETISRRILVGEAGQRVQGLLAKVGITRGYVMVNTFVYSVYGQGGGSKHAKDPAVAAYRNRWLDALLTDGEITAVLTLGTLAKIAYGLWADTQPTLAPNLHLAAVRHPTYPESAAASGSGTLEETTARLLADWNGALPALKEHVKPDSGSINGPLILYGTRWADGDLQPIPEADLPAGCPAWWRAVEAWAARTGENPQKKRATITVTVPRKAQTWPPVEP